MKFRKYDPQKDKKATHRMWHEAGWVGDGKEGEQAIDAFLKGSRALVADINGEAECLANSMPGVIRYLDEDLPLSAVTAVLTSRIARRQGLAKRLTAQVIAADAAEGALVSGLGMFEQGFYNKLGFGTGPYEHWFSFDPTQLKVKYKARIPRRLTKADWKMVHAAALARRRAHGGANIYPPELIRAEMGWSENGFGLGYNDGPHGELTHFFWGTPAGEYGPYTILFIAYQNRDQFLELMTLLKNLGDQVRQVTVREPGGIQLQDLLDQPFRYRWLSEKGKYENRARAIAYWQLRICDLSGCLGRTHLPGNEVQFNLKLTDPIENYLDDDSPWQGISGDYVVTLGSSSGAAEGVDSSLPTLTASVGAFTRLWMGALSATSLSITDNLSGPEELLEALDRVLCLPAPKLDWDF